MPSAQHCLFYKFEGLPLETKRACSDYPGGISEGLKAAPDSTELRDTIVATPEVGTSPQVKFRG
ncbi:hypothetical protein ACU8KH_04894 [Lachancea thermotolerans]